MTTEDLDKVLSTLSVEKTITFFNDVSEKDRKALAPRALQWLEVSSMHHTTDTELNFYLTQAQNKLIGLLTTGMDAPKRIQRLIKQVEDAKLQAKSMPPQVVKKEAIEVASIAVMATSGITDIKKKDVVPLPNHCYQIIAARQPSWMAAWIEWIATETPHSHWAVARRLECEGIVAIEHTPSYLSGMALSLPGVIPQPPNRWENGKVVQAEIVEGTVAEAFLADERLIELLWEMLADDLSMRLLTHEQGPPSGRNAWQGENISRWQLTQLAGGRWKRGLLRLCKEQKIDRLRLINTILPIFVRFNLEHSDSGSTLQVSWFTDLHDALELTESESFALHQDYLRLLGCRNPKVVLWSLQKLTSLVGHPDFPVEVVCESIPTVFLLKGKEHSAQALKCLKEIVDKHPTSKRIAAMAAIEAMDSESSDVQKRALTLLTKLKAKDDKLIALMQNKLPRINIQHRQQAADWVGVGTTSLTADQVDKNETIVADNVIQLRPSKSSKPEEEQSVPPAIDLEEYYRRCEALPNIFRSAAKLDMVLEALSSNVHELGALEFTGMDIPRLNPDKRLPVLKDLDSMIFFTSRILHQQWGFVPTAEEVEIMLDGFARLGAEQPPDFKARTDALLGIARSVGFSIDPIMNTTVTWITGHEEANWLRHFAKSLSQLNKVDDVVRRRFVKVGKKVANRESVILLSTPTHEGGWIDPVILVERARTLSNTNPGYQKGFFSQFLGVLGLTKGERDIEDECLALLRIAPDNRELALARAVKLPRSEFIQALRYALGDDDIQIGETPAVWIAAARARSPLGDDSRVEARHRGLGPDSATRARYELTFTTVQPKVIRSHTTDPKWKLLSSFPPCPPIRDSPRSW